MKLFHYFYLIFSYLTCNVAFVLYSIAEIIIFAIYVNGGMEYESFRIVSLVIVYIIVWRYTDEMIDITKSFRVHATRKMTIIHSIFTISTALIIIFSRSNAIPLLLVCVPESIIYRIKCAKNREECSPMYSYSYKEFNDYSDDEIDVELGEDDFDD